MDNGKEVFSDFQTILKTRVGVELYIPPPEGEKGFPLSHYVLTDKLCSRKQSSISNGFFYLFIFYLKAQSDNMTIIAIFDSGSTEIAKCVFFPCTSKFILHPTVTQK